MPFPAERRHNPSPWITATDANISTQLSTGRLCSSAPPIAYILPPMASHPANPRSRFPSAAESIRGRISSPIATPNSLEDFVFSNLTVGVTTPLAAELRKTDLDTFENPGRPAPSPSPQPQVQFNNLSSLSSLHSPGIGAGAGDETDSFVGTQSRRIPKRVKFSLRTALGRVFQKRWKQSGRESFRFASSTSPSPLALASGNRPAKSHQSEHLVALLPTAKSGDLKRSNSMPAAELGRALHSISPVDSAAIESGCDSLQPDTSPKRPRATTAFGPAAVTHPLHPSLDSLEPSGLSPRPASSHARGSRALVKQADFINHSHNDHDYEAIGMAITLDPPADLPLSPMQHRRRSRSLSGLPDMSDKWTDIRRRSDEIRHWRVTYCPDLGIDRCARSDPDCYGVQDRLTPVTSLHVVQHDGAVTTTANGTPTAPSSRLSTKTDVISPLIIRKCPDPRLSLAARRAGNCELPTVGSLASRVSSIEARLVHVETLVSSLLQSAASPGGVSQAHSRLQDFDLIAARPLPPVRAASVTPTLQRTSDQTERGLELGAPAGLVRSEPTERLELAAKLNQLEQLFGMARWNRPSGPLTASASPNMEMQSGFEHDDDDGNDDHDDQDDDDKELEDGDKAADRTDRFSTGPQAAAVREGFDLFLPTAGRMNNGHDTPHELEARLYHPRQALNLTERLEGPGSREATRTLSLSQLTYKKLKA